MKYFAYGVVCLLVMALGFGAGYLYLMIKQTTVASSSHTVQCSLHLERVFESYLADLAHMNEFKEEQAITYATERMADIEACQLVDVIIHGVFLNNDHLVFVITGTPTVDRMDVTRQEYRVEVPLPIREPGE